MFGVFELRKAAGVVLPAWKGIVSAAQFHGNGHTIVGGAWGVIFLGVSGITMGVVFITAIVWSHACL